MSAIAPTLGDNPAERHKNTQQPNLEDQRFAFSPYAEHLLVTAEEALAVARQETPSIQGVLIIGSYTRAQETKNSDFDFTIVCDSSLSSIWYKDEKRFLELINERLTSPLPIEDSPRPIDISPHGMINHLERLDDLHQRITSLPNPVEPRATNPEFLDQLLEHGANSRLFRLFNHAIGEPILKARKAVLDTLEQHPSGDEQFAILMGQLQILERIFARKKNPDTPLYQHFPKTIKQGREYFDTADYDTINGVPILTDGTHNGSSTKNSLAQVAMHQAG
jgi:predicted nucleotidyltransferase